MDTPARHDQLGQPTLAAWFGAQNGYLDMAAMRPNPPCEARQRDGPGTYHLHLCVLVPAANSNNNVRGDMPFGEPFG